MDGAATMAGGGVGNVSVVNGMAHIDLVVARPPVAEGQQPQIEPVQHLVMALPQFVRLCAEMVGQLQRMEAKGLIARKQQAYVGLAPVCEALCQMAGHLQKMEARGV